jgi:membrane dipeptidase
MPRAAGETTIERARRLHAEAVVLDSHVDTTQRLLNPSWDFSARDPRGHVDLPRLHEGGISGAVFAVYAGAPMAPGEGVAAARRQIRAIRETALRCSREVVPARTAKDVRAAKRDGKLALMTAVEGGYLIEDSLDVLREFREEGALYMTLTHAFHTPWADSSGVHQDLAPRHGGLTGFGREVIREMNRIGMIVDVSHVSDETFWQVAETSTAPIIASHSSCRAVSSHRRNLTDEMIRAIAETGGVVQINFAAAFVDPDFPEVPPDLPGAWPDEAAVREFLAGYATPLARLADHFEHALHLVGPQHVGIGSDFDGTMALPEGMEDCSRLPFLTAALFDRGFTEADLRPVLGENLLRVMDRCQSGR